jgi:hypothetical protein
MPKGSERRSRLARLSLDPPCLTPLMCHDVPSCGSVVPVEAIDVLKLRAIPADDWSAICSTARRYVVVLIAECAGISGPISGAAAT